MKTNYFLIPLVLLASLKLTAQCNGSMSLCNKKYNEVAYLTTHNAFNSTENNFKSPNQNKNLTSQLNDGVRGLMLDVYDLNGIATQYHGLSFLGTKTLLSDLVEIKAFLDSHPKEIVTIIFECYTTANLIEQTINQAGLFNYLYTHTPNTAWSTLQTMIDTNKRLVILTDKKDASPAQGWYHYVWDYAVETSFTAHSTADFNCNYRRGNPANDLFILNHFITDSTFGIGVENQASIANANPYFINRAKQCFQEKSKFPNFVAIDFYEKGDGLAVVNELNKVTSSLSLTSFNGETAVTLFPNPASSFIQLADYLGETSYDIYSIIGAKVKRGIVPSNHSIDIQGLSKGVYFLKFENGTTYKFIKE